MAELERELRELAGELEFPAAPDLVTPVLRRIAESRRRPWWRSRPLAVALAVVALGIAVAFAVPPARTAILRVFGVGGVRVELVDRLPEKEVRGGLVLGERVSVEEARRRVRFPVGVPSAEGFGEPDAVYVSDRVPGGVVFLVYGSTDRPRALLTQFRALDTYADKAVGPGTRLREVSVGRYPGYWIFGRPHAFAFVNVAGQNQAGAFRLATNTLLWVRNGVTIRLEGELTGAEAVRVGTSLRFR